MTSTYTLDQLCALTDMTKRTVRYYMQLGLVDRPIGETRAAHYTSLHLEQLLQIRKLADAGVSLERIREVLAGGESPVPDRVRQPGAISLLKYVVTHDAGVLINPMIVNGQILGGICQGIGGCLLEKIVYDEYGQNLSATFVDYLLPVATQMPEVEIIHFESPSPLNELGIKGLGEGGVVGPPAVIINGVCDALKPLKFQIFDSFVSQSDIVAAFNVGKK